MCAFVSQPCTLPPNKNTPPHTHTPKQTPKVFFLLKESELTPSGANLLDGRYAVFGYVVEGQDALGYFKVGDKIDYIKVVGGAENLVNGGK